MRFLGFPNWTFRTTRHAFSIDRLRLIALCLGLAFPLAACHRPAGNADGDAAMFTDNHGLLTVPATSPLRSHLAIQAVGNGGGAPTLDLPAAVEADPARVVNILAPLTGRVVSLKVGLGDQVKQGQVLAVLASGDFAQAHADVDKAQDACVLAKKALDRGRGVLAAGGAANKDMEAIQSAYNQAQDELTRAQTRLASLSGSAADHARELVLTAPQSGIVTTLAVASGAQVSDPTATLMTVTNTDRVFVTANVAESDIGKAAIGTDAEIVLAAHPDQTLHGKISEINAVVEPDTRRQKIWIAFANGDGRLMPNMYATVRLAVRSAGAVSLPQSALLMNNNSISVFVEVRPWVFQRRAIVIGDETETTARVLSGLKAGDRVVVRGGVLLND